jgi:photosystem II stability/assembly factor-like uncharacterized protein
MTAARTAAAALVMWSIAVAPTQAAPVSTVGSGWLWGDPAPQGETLTQVAFKGDVGYAAGEGGTVLRSEDGGKSWTGSSSGTTANLTQLQEPDPSTVIVGGGCTLRGSTDGGASFHRMPFGAETGCASQIAALSFPSASTGFIELADGSILSTQDGGQTWQPRTRVPLIEKLTVDDLDFISPSVGFAVASGDHREGGHLYRTSDGGGSWTPVAAPVYEPLYSVTFVSPTVGYAVGGGYPPPLATKAGSVLLATEDGGLTWTERPMAIPGVSFSVPPGLQQIVCSDALDCLISTSVEGAPANVLVRTTDGGMSGTAISPSAQGLLSVALTSGSGAIAVGAGGTTVLSPDRGATFPTMLSHGLGVELTGAVRTGSSSQHAYVAGAAGQIATTGNGGESWGLLHVPTSAKLADVAFPTEQDGYTVDAAGVLYGTANGGSSWSILGSNPASSRVLAPNADTVLEIGPTGLRRSTNGGASFAAVKGSIVVGHRHRRALRLSLSAFPLFAGAQQVGGATIAWGDEAIESTDGGAHWKPIPRPLSGGIVEGLSFVSPTTGYELSRQRLFFTRNSGRSWQEISSLGIQPRGGEGQLSFSSVADGYVIGTFHGRRDVVLRTGDGGRTWAPEILPRTVESVTAGGGVDYARGTGNTLFLTNDGGLSPSASSLTLALAGPHRLSRAKLHRRHGRVVLSGRLSPAQGGETVTISYRNTGMSAWTHRDVTVASDGSYSLTLAGIASSTSFVAQFLGASPIAGSGSPAVALTVTRR